ncbi:MAG: helix-turn-helix domain-containing protein [Chloroflexota bacterium]
MLASRSTVPVKTPLWALRNAKVLSQRELADRSGVSQTTIVKIESGERHPHPGTLRKLAAALGVDVEKLVPQQAQPSVHGSAKSNTSALRSRDRR